MEFIDYNKGENLGSIIIHGNGNYSAVTACFSRVFKSLKGAEKAMESFGYKRSVKK